MLQVSYTSGLLEAGLDEAGRGCLAGPVYAAAVVLPSGYANAELNDSKKLSSSKRDRLRRMIESEAVAWAVASVPPEVIDKINILNASILAMQWAVGKLRVVPELLLVDGNRFKPMDNIRHQCIIKGDAIFMSIAAASILAKTHRDEFMCGIGKDYPHFGWERNKGYPSSSHREAIYHHGPCIHHRMSYRLYAQLKLAL